MVESFAAAKGITENADYKKIPLSVSSKKIDLQKIIEKKRKNLSALKCSSIENEKLVEKAGQDLVKAIEEVKSKSMQELKDRTSDLTKSLEDDIKRCEFATTELNFTLHQYQDKTKAKGERECLFNFCKCEEALECAELLGKEIYPQDVRVEFKPDPDIAKGIASKQLGSLHVQPESVPRVSPPLSPNIKTNEDQKNCDITAACMLANGHLALIDSRNSKLKQVDDKLIVVAEISLPQFPYSVCPVSNTRNIAVAICDWSSRNEINIFGEKDGYLTNVHKVNLSHDCVCLGSMNDELFVGSTNGIYVYNAKDLYESKPNEKNVRHIYKKAASAFALSNDGFKIFILDKDTNRIVSIDKNGKEITAISTDDVKGPHGVCVAGNDIAFVCGNLSNNVVLFGRSFNRCLKVIATEADGVLKPNCVLYDRRSLQLFVGQQDCNNLLVFKVQRM